jgi:hypothetical protein
MNHYFNLLTLLVLSLLGSCQNDNTQLSPQTGLEGTWEWVSTTGGLAGIHDTPASTGKTLRYEFTSEGAYTITENGTVTSQGTYTIAKRNCIHSGDQKDFIDFSSEEVADRTIETVDEKTLGLSDEYFDGYGLTFRRRIFDASVQERD